MYRDEAVNNRKNQWRGKAILLPGISLWISFSLWLFFFIIFCLFITKGTYTRRVNVTGEISTFPRVAKVYSSAQGIVVKKYVIEGQQVKVGTPIYKIDVSKSTHSGVISENQHNDITIQLDRISNIIKRLEESKKNVLNMLEKHKSQYTSALKSSSDIVRKAEEGIGIMKENMKNYYIYQKKGLITKDQLANQVSLYYQQQGSLLGLSVQNEENALQISNIDSQIQTQAASYDNEIYQMELQRYELKKELLNVDAEGEVIIRASTNGRIDSLSVTVGQMVNIGDSLLQILPHNIDSYALVLWVPNDAIPYIKAGDKVNIRYDAFPSQKFGQFSGHVSIISKAPASLQEIQSYHSAPDSVFNVPYYKLIVIPSKKSIPYGNKMIKLENGMKAKSTLFLEKRRI